MKVVFEQTVSQLTMSQPEGIDLGAALYGLGKAYFELGDGGNARSALERALPLLQKHDCLEEIAYTLELTGSVEIFEMLSGHSSALARALELYQRLQNWAGVARVLARQAEGAMLNYDLEMGKAKIQESYELAVSLKDRFLLSTVLNIRAYVAVKCGNFDEAVMFSERCLSLLERGKYPLNRAGGLNQLGLALARSGAHERAEVVFREVCAIADTAGNRAMAATTKTNLCWSLYVQEKYWEGLEIGADALGLHREMQAASAVIANDLCNLAHILTALGHYREAEAHYREAWSIRQGSEDWYIAEALGGMGNLLAYSGQVERAVSILSMLVIHPRTSLQIKLALEAFLAKLRPQLSPESYAAAEKNGTLLERDIILQEVLAAKPIFN